VCLDKEREEKKLAERRHKELLEATRAQAGGGTARGGSDDHDSRASGPGLGSAVASAAGSVAGAVGGEAASAVGSFLKVLGFLLVWPYIIMFRVGKWSVNKYGWKPTLIGAAVLLTFPIGPLCAAAYMSNKRFGWKVTVAWISALIVLRAIASLVSPAEPPADTPVPVVAPVPVGPVTK
jgi:hypothetical protein